MTPDDVGDGSGLQRAVGGGEVQARRSWLAGVWSYGEQNAGTIVFWLLFALPFMSVLAWIIAQCLGKGAAYDAWLKRWFGWVPRVGPARSYSGPTRERSSSSRRDDDYSGGGGRFGGGGASGNW